MMSKQVLVELIQRYCLICEVRMCNRTQTAVEMAKNKRQLGKGEIVIMFQQVAIDLAKQGERMSELEKQISDLKEQTSNRGMATASGQKTPPASRIAANAFFIFASFSLDGYYDECAS